MNKTTLILIILVSILGSSCVKYRTLINYADRPPVPNSTETIANYQPIVIQPNDILQIQISSTSAAAAAAFNNSGESSGGNQQSSGLGGFLVDENGEVELPTLGTIKLENLTLAEARQTVKNALQPYFNETPIVNVRLLNFKVTVNGEVNNPSTFTVSNGRITLLEAITLAGDFTNFSMRDSILIVREFENERTFGYANFNDVEVFNSPYFYLQQNDVIYVKPIPNKKATVRDPTSKILPYVGVVTSLVAFLVSVARR